MTIHFNSFAGLGALFVAANITCAQPVTAVSGSSGEGQGAVAVNPATGLPAVQTKFAQAEEQLEAAQTALAKAGGGGSLAPWVIAGGGVGSSSRSLIIPKDGSDGKALEECEEDLNVMARILDKAVNHRSGKSRNAMGITVHSGLFGDSPAPRNIYIEGYGALFFLDVNYPLVAPPAKKADAEPKEDSSSEWEETRRELNHPDPWGQSYSIVPPPVTFGAGPTEEYDAEKVEDLKKDLIAALKNAAHIRRLKSDEIVALVVSGRNRGLEPKVITRKTSGGGGGGGFSSSTSTVKMERYGQRGTENRGSKMILRARQSDIEALQKGKLTVEEFQKTVSVQVY